MTLMKKVLQNILIVAGVMGGVAVAYGPSAEARNYGWAYPNWKNECLDQDWVSVNCTSEESTEHYKNGSYKEEIIYEVHGYDVDREEAWEISNGDSGYGHDAITYEWARRMRDDFANRLGRAVNWEF